MKSGAVPRGNALIRPYILTRTLDVFFHPPKRTNRKNTVPLIKDAEWLNAGRPGMKLENPNENILVSKLGGGSTNPLRDIDMLTIMLARLGAELHPAHRFSSEIVAKNMVTLLDTNLVRDKYLTVFRSEPGLARAAGTIWAREGMFENNLLRALHDASLWCGVFENGKGSNFVAKILC